jgi:hypothetical protein
VALLRETQRWTGESQMIRFYRQSSDNPQSTKGWNELFGISWKNIIIQIQEQTALGIVGYIIYKFNQQWPNNLRIWTAGALAPGEMVDASSTVTSHPLLPERQMPRGLNEDPATHRRHPERRRGQNGPWLPADPLNHRRSCGHVTYGKSCCWWLMRGIQQLW